MTEFRIAVPLEWARALVLTEEVEREFTGNEEVELIKDDPQKGYRAVDPAILIAVVSSAGTALGAFIAGLLRIAERSSSNMVVLQAGQKRIEMPARTPPDKVDKLINWVRALDDEKVDLHFE